jgi:hypothetical protein
VKQGPIVIATQNSIGFLEKVWRNRGENMDFALLPVQLKNMFTVLIVICNLNMRLIADLFYG